MPLFDSVKEAITQKNSSLNKPVFYKSDSDAEKQLEQLEELLKTAPGNVKWKIREDLIYLSTV